MENGYYKFPALEYMIIIFLTICILGAISQVFLVIAFLKDPLKCFRNSGTYLMANLAVSDFLTCFFASFSYCITKTIYFPLQFCIWTSGAVSVLSIVSISFDRFLIVVYPLKHRVLMRGKAVVVWLACIWLIGCVFPMKAILSLILARNNELDLIVMNLLAASSIIFAGIMYGMTYYKLKKQSRNFAVENLSNRQQQARVIKEKQFLRTIILVACIALACFVPSTILHHFTALQEGATNVVVAQVLADASSNLLFVNFAVNPLVYVLRLPNYRKSFYLMYCCKKVT